MADLADKLPAETEPPVLDSKAVQPGLRKVVSGAIAAVVAALLTKAANDWLGVPLDAHPIGATLPSWSEAITAVAGLAAVYGTNEVYALLDRGDDGTLPVSR